MSEVPLARASHLLLYSGMLRAAGLSVERELARAKLPENLEETPGAFISGIYAYDFFEGCARRLGADDIGYRAASVVSINHLGPSFLRLAAATRSGRSLMRVFAKYLSSESNVLRNGIVSEGNNSRLFSDIGTSTYTPDQRHSEWVRIRGLILVARMFAGPNWWPEEITFVSRFRVCEEALQEFGNTRLFFGHRHTSITIPTILLSTSRPAFANQLDDLNSSSLPSDRLTFREGPAPSNYIGAIRAVIRPYLNQHYPDINMAAEMAETSVRTFQRHLGQYGLSYSKLVQDERFEIARELLFDRDIKIIDVGFAAGYDNPQNFSRAFRKEFGVSPRAYRSALFSAQL